MSRERDVRNAMRDALLATSAFDDVLIGRDVEDYGAGGIGAWCRIDPIGDSGRGMWDEGDELEVTSKVKITITARHEDQQMRDEMAERLVNVARNAINDQSHASLTMPGLTGFDSARWLPPKHPARQVEATFSYRYFQDDNTYDTAE